MRNCERSSLVAKNFLHFISVSSKEFRLISTGDIYRQQDKCDIKKVSYIGSVKVGLSGKELTLSKTSPGFYMSAVQVL